MPIDRERPVEMPQDPPARPRDHESVVLPCGVRLVGAYAYEDAIAACQPTTPVPSAKREKPRALFPAKAPAVTADARPLSEREREVLSLLVGGASDKEVAGALGLSRSTVESHVGNLYLKTGAANRVQLGVVAIERGLIWSSFGGDQAIG
jgi:DNA-binding CsgD family transcriptional regulator